PDGGKAVAMMLANPLREAADERLELKVWPVGDDQLIGVGKPNEALLHEALALRDLELLCDEALEPGWHRGFDLKPDDGATPPALQRRFEQSHQVLGLFLDLDVTVA